MLNTLTRIFLSTAVVLSLASCAVLDTNQKQGTTVGAGVGAGVGAMPGQAIGEESGATMIGAGVGATSGGLAGNQIGVYMDKQEQELRNAMARSKAAGIRCTQNVLTATFKSQVFFEHDSAALLPGGDTEISRVASVLNKYRQTQIEVNGHTDATGSEQYNRQLSQRQAESVKNALVQQGVAPQRIMARGYGESRPISSADAMNRRVEIVIVPIKQG